MPTLRSQRSKPSSRKKKEEEEVEEMPPPSPPPKTRPTRARKPTSKVKESAEVEELSTSPAPSTKSSRSKARPKKKAAPPVEVVEEVSAPSPPPSVVPSTKSTRSGRTKKEKKEEDVDVKKETKTATAKKKEPKSKKAAKPAAEEPVVLEEPEEPKEKEVKEKAKRPARTATTKKTAAGKKKVKEPEPEPEVSSLSDDISDEDMVRTRGNKLTREKMHKQYVTPLKSAIGAGLCDSVPKILNKLKQNAEDKKSEKKFQKLLTLGKTDLSMPPPPAPGPAPKTKRGKAKRVRTPDKDKSRPADAKTVPESFNFAEETRKEQPPAKKMILEPEPPQEIKSIPKAVSPPPKTDAIADEPSPSDSKKEEEEMDIFEYSAVVETEDANKTEDFNEKKLSEKVEPKPAPEPKKPDLSFDATFTFDTPPSKPHLPAGNATFTPEQDPDTPKSEAADKTIVISNKKKTSQSNENVVLAPASPEPEEESKKEVPASAVSGKASSPDDLLNDNHEKSDEQSPCSSIANLNSTYVVPSINKNAKPAALNVTVCLKSETIPDVVEIKPPPQVAAKPFLPQGGSRFVCDSPASRTFCKEPPSLAMVVEEEDEQPRKNSQPKVDKKSEKLKPQPVVKPVPKEKKGVSSSSSSSSSSMKSASSQPCLATSSNKLPTSATKNGPIHGSAGKLHEMPKVVKHLDLDEAEKRRQALMQQKVENSKKKNAEWAKKTAELKKLEDEKRMKEKPKVVLPVPSQSTLKKPTVPATIGKAAADGPGLFSKPKHVLGPSTTKPIGATALNVPKKPFLKPIVKPPSAPVEIVDLDESFKSAHNFSSFLDQTTEGHLSSYDITMYEDLDEDLKHRENKTLPKWASDREALKAALFSMVLLPEYKNKLPDVFPKPDKTYKLFPTTSHR